MQGTLTITGGTAGGIAGSNPSPGSISNVLADIIITSNASYTSGIAGNSTGYTSGIMEHGSVTGGYKSGALTCDTCGTIVGYTSSAVTVAGSYGNSGTVFSSANVNNLIKYNDYILDTKYGGDDDNDGYYFDYNSDSSNIIIKSLAEFPLDTSGEPLFQILV